MDIAELNRRSMEDLLEIAGDLEIDNHQRLARRELIHEIEQGLLAADESLVGEGILEILPEGYGFLRSPEWNYLPGPNDMYVSPSQIKRFDLRTGDEILGQVRPPKKGERYLALLRIKSLNGAEPDRASIRPAFDDLRPTYPDARFKLEVPGPGGSLAMRIVDLIAPIGKGQRGLIVSPPKAGKTTILQQMANSISTNAPETHLIVLLIDERPEEVTDMARRVGAEVISSTFDEPAHRHVQVAKMVLERAKRLVEQGRDVVILLDSITRLARAYNTTMPHSGRILSGGVDANALQKPKRFFGSARKVLDGGSLTIVATALVETGSRMDDVIFEEFKGTGNMELVLDREISERRIFPAIDLNRSGTRKEEILLTDTELNRVFLLRNFLSDMSPPEAIDFLIQRMGQTTDNREFLDAMAKGI